MTKKQAIINLIQKKENNYTPHHFDLTMKITDELAKHYNIPSEEVEEFIGNHMLYVDFNAPLGKSTGYRVKQSEGSYLVDEFGVSWDNARLYEIGDWGIVDHPVKDLDLDGYSFPSGKGEGRYENAAKQMERFPDRFNVLRMTGLFDTAWHITGLEDFLVAMMVEKDVANTILDNCEEFIKDVIRSAPSNINAVRFIEDWGVQKGLLFSRELWLEFFKPRLKRIHAVCREKGFYVMHHTCGDVTDLFNDIVEIGIDIIDAIQPESMDIEFIKNTYGDKIVLFGALSAQSTLPFGTPEDVLNEAEKTLKIMGKNGGYIIGPAGSFSTDTPTENVVALTEFCKELAQKGI